MHERWGKKDHSSHSTLIYHVLSAQWGRIKVFCSPLPTPPVITNAIRLVFLKMGSGHLYFKQLRSVSDVCSLLSTGFQNKFQTFMHSFYGCSHLAPIYLSSFVAYCFPLSAHQLIKSFRLLSKKLLSKGLLVARKSWKIRILSTVKNFEGKL